METNEIKALFSLLDDPDPEIQVQIKERIVSEGRKLLPYLEGYLADLEGQGPAAAIAQDIYRDIQIGSLRRELSEWFDSGAEDLIEGAIIIARYEYPDLEVEEIYNFISKVRQDVWLELNESLTAFEAIKVFNIVFFDEYGFSGNKEEYHQIENSFINKVIENRRGNPLLLSILYMSIAQQLELPIQGINLPNHFLVAYMDEFGIAEKMGLDTGNVLFYINPFSRGAILHKAEIETFLGHLDLRPEPRFFIPCDHGDMICRMINNLVHAYRKSGEESKAEELSQFIQLVSSRTV